MINYTIRYAAHPNDVKGYDTQKLRDEFLIPTLFATNEINLVYSLYDRLIVGGAQPTTEPITLIAIDPIKAPFFLHRREIGIINVGGAGTVTTTDGATFHIGYKEALYLGKGDRDVTFVSDDAASPAKFYINSAPAHATYPDKKVTKDDAIKAEMGSLEGANHRIINKLIVKEVLPTCQLQMGMTELAAGSVWNTIPPHTHNRRMEAYMYFDLPETAAVCHFMGELTESRHVWMAGEQAILSPTWSMHSACATSAYTFIWGMAGENLDYGDMDTVAVTELR